MYSICLNTVFMFQLQQYVDKQNAGKFFARALAFCHIGPSGLGADGELHVQKRVGTALPVELGPFEDLKAHALVKAARLRVLLVHGQPVYAEAVNPVPEQPPAQPLPALLRRDEQHLKAPVLNSHERGGRAAFLRDDEDFNREQRLRDIFAKARYLALGQE